MEKYPDGGKQWVYSVNSQGKKVGPFKEFYPNGKLKTQARYRLDKLVGQFKQFDSKGRLQLQANYRDGDLDGARQEYVDGRLVKEEIWLNGVLLAPRSHGDPGRGAQSDPVAEDSDGGQAAASHAPGATGPGDSRPASPARGGLADADGVSLRLRPALPRHDAGLDLHRARRGRLGAADEDQQDDAHAGESGPARGRVPLCLRGDRQFEPLRCPGPCRCGERLHGRLRRGRTSSGWDIAAGASTRRWPRPVSAAAASSR